MQDMQAYTDQQSYSVATFGNADQLTLCNAMRTVRPPFQFRLLYLVYVLDDG
jgi:hypothetical protein